MTTNLTRRTALLGTAALPLAPATAMAQGSEAEDPAVTAMWEGIAAA